MVQISPAENKKRHKAAHAELVKAAKKYIGSRGCTSIYKLIGKRSGCSHITVRNYIDGDYKDGFLTEKLTYEFLNYTP